MYTQCPECRTTYQIGPEDLRRAHGRVRCGACNTVFDALETLSHEPPPVHPDEPRESAEPATAPGHAVEPEPEPEREAAGGWTADAQVEPEPETEPEAGPGHEPEREREDESEEAPLPVAEPEAEWEPVATADVAGEPEADLPAETEPPPEAAPEPEEAPLRFDDDTPLEEVLASFGADLTEEPGDEEADRTAEPGREAEAGELEAAAPETPSVTGEAEETEDLGDEDEWRALLAELELDESALGAGLDRESEDEAAEPAAERVELPAGGEEEAPPGEPTEEAAVEPEPEPRAEDEEPVPAADEQAEREEARERDELAASAALFDEIVQSGEFAAILGPDNEAAAAAAGAAGVRDRREGDEREEPAAPAPADAETAARPQAGDGGQPPAEEDEELIDQTLLPRRRSRSRTLLWSVAAMLLVAALGAQVIHGQRAQLATHPDFGPRLQQIYGAFGVEVPPRWDIGALCVESSSGDAGDNTLEITSVIVHQGDRPQPYPLLQVALTDRWQSVIGSRSVEADEYLPAEGLHEGRMYPGDRVRARARLADPGSEAAGYELHVCYRDPDGDLRCSGACR